MASILSTMKRGVWVCGCHWDDGQVAGSGGEDVEGDEVADFAGEREDLQY